MTANPVPLRVTDNNLWPFDLAGGGVLLVDAGWEPDGDTGVWQSIETQAAGLGFATADVRVVVITHEHIDHAGLTAKWVREGARVVAGQAGRRALSTGLEGLRAQRQARTAEFVRQGMPSDLAAGLLGTRTAQQRWEACPVDLIDAAEECGPWALADGRVLRLQPAPGHTPGNLVALVEGAGDLDLCSGDTLLPTTIPTPGLHFPNALEGDTTRWPSLPPFLASVAALRALPITRILPGHGEGVADPQRLFTQFEAHHARRGARVRAALAAARSATAFEVARAVFPRLPDDRIGQALTETIGHLDVLAGAGLAEAVTQGNRVVWRSVTSA